MVFFHIYTNNFQSNLHSVTQHLIFSELYNLLVEKQSQFSQLPVVHKQQPHMYSFHSEFDVIKYYKEYQMISSYSYLFKYIIIGDASVGKSCLLMQFLQGRFKQDSETTVGVQFGSKILELGSERLKLQIWDTAGQEIFKSITRSYYRGSIGAILCYDITSRQSFKNLRKWVDQTRNYANQKLSIILVGNKVDLESRREVSTQQGKKFAQQYNMLFLECSAKDTEKTCQVFEKLAEQIIRKVDQGIVDPRNQSLGIKIGNFKSKRNSTNGQQTQGICC